MGALTSGLNPSLSQLLGAERSGGRANKEFSVILL